MQKLRIGVLGSGKGSNFRAILEAIQAGTLQAEVAMVISDVEGAGIIDLAREAKLPRRLAIDPTYKTKLSPEMEAEVVSQLKRVQIDLILLEGFPKRVINIHPSLLPKYPGLEAWRQALEAGEKVTGCTVHYVDAGMDTGEIIAQAEVPVLPDDSATTLHARIQKAEHILYPEVIERFAKGELP